MDQQQNTCDKLVFAVLQGDDYDVVVRGLTQNGFYVTLLNSVGGFLRKRSVTIMIGLPSDRLDLALSILKEHAGQRTETVYQNIVPPHITAPSMIPAIPLQVPCGGATVFVVDLVKMERI